MDAHKYELIVSWSEEGDAFIFDVPEHPGCMAHGVTPGDAVANAQDAIALWIDTARDIGRQAPAPKGRRLLSAQPRDLQVPSPMVCAGDETV